MWKLLQALKTRTLTTALVVVATLMLALWSAGQNATFAGVPVSDGALQQQILPGSSGFQTTSGARELSARQRMDAFRLCGHAQNAPDNDQPFDTSWQTLSTPMAKSSIALVIAPRALAPCAHSFPFDPRGPPAV